MSTEGAGGSKEQGMAGLAKDKPPSFQPVVLVSYRPGAKFKLFHLQPADGSETPSPRLSVGDDTYHPR